MFIIDLKYLLQLIEYKDNQSCILFLQTRIKYLSFQISDETDLNETNIEKISNIFLHLRHIIIENKLPNISNENILLLILNSFQNHLLVSIIIRGLTTEELRTNPSQWLINHTYLKQIPNQFLTQCDEIEFKIWL